MPTIFMKVSPKVHSAVMRLAREQRIRAWKALEFLIPVALLEDLNSSIQQKTEGRAIRQDTPRPSLITPSDN
jgi:hypothetical protein